MEVENLKGGSFGADQVPECVPRGFCSAPNLLVQPASLGTPHVLLALEGQFDGGTAAIAWELFEVQPDKRGSATAEFSGHYPVREKELPDKMPSRPERSQGSYRNALRPFVVLALNPCPGVT